MAFFKGTPVAKHPKESASADPSEAAEASDPKKQLPPLPPESIKVMEDMVTAAEAQIHHGPDHGSDSADLRAQMAALAPGWQAQGDVQSKTSMYPSGAGILGHPDRPLIATVKTPSVGRIVTYTDSYQHNKLRPAIVEAVHADGAVDLIVFDSGQNPAVVPVRGVRFSAESISGTWKWPAIV